jgi:outer membrane protein TolC
VGLQYELPLDDRSKEGERAAARLSVRIAREQLREAEHQVRADAARTIEESATARKRLALAEATHEVAKQQAEAERERFRLGAATFVSVRDAEEAVREAELRVTRARVDRVIAQLELQHLTGTLLTHIAALERQKSP